MIIAKEKRIAKDDPYLWQIIQVERARVLRQEEDNTKSSDAGSRENPNTDAGIDFSLITEAAASRQREWANSGTYIGLDRDDRVANTQSAAFVEVIDQILRVALERQPVLTTELRYHDILWIAFKAGMRELILDQEYQNLSRSVLHFNVSFFYLTC